MSVVLVEKAALIANDGVSLWLQVVSGARFGCGDSRATGLPQKVRDTFAPQKEAQTMKSSKKYMVYPTDNNVQGHADFGTRFTDRFLRKARETMLQEERFFSNGGKVSLEDLDEIAELVDEMMKNPAEKAKFKQSLTQEFTRTLLVFRGEAGVCGGMVCTWAQNYLTTGNPEAPIDQNDAMQLQGDQEVTFFKRRMVRKDGDSVAVARDKALKSRGMCETTVIQSAHFPNRSDKFKQATAIILNWVYFEENNPFVLSVQLGNSRHAIGLLYHDDDYYILEPNYGLFRFQSEGTTTGRELALREINNHFVTTLKPSSPWQLKAFSAAA